MTISGALLTEFEEEMINTRKVLECVPEDKFSWKPHEKSFTLGRLANHIARLPIMPQVIINRGGPGPSNAKSKTELLASFDQTVAASREALASMDDEYLAKTIRVTPETSKTVYVALRGRGLMNHLIHHRGQLTVYLRLLDVPLPGMYGPSADEKS
jgi:uncharacterized damage-inducible protein DinB